MHRFKNILVGLDLSSGDRIVARELNPATQEAIRQALWVAEHFDANVTFSAGLDVSAQTEELISQDIEHLIQNVDDDAAELLRELRRQVQKAGVKCEVHIAHGSGWETLVRKVVRDKHDLLIAGTRHHTVLDRMLFGTTGIKLLRYCPCPVWLTKPGFSEIDLVNVLVADDLRDVGMECLQIAVEGGQTRDTRTSVLHVIENSLAATAQTVEEANEIRQRELEGAEQSLQERLSQTDYRTLQHGVKLHVVHGRADEEIVKAVKEYEIDLLIMGTAGLSGLSGFLFGNTIERLLPEIDCSVLAVKPADFKCPVTAD